MSLSDKLTQLKVGETYMMDYHGVRMGVEYCMKNEEMTLVSKGYFELTRGVEADTFDFLPNEPGQKKVTFYWYPNHPERNCPNITNITKIE